MLITVYQKTSLGWQQIRQFYWWRVDTVEEIKQKEDLGLQEPTTNHIYTRCPGCGRRMARQRILLRHQCPGTLTTQPVTKTRRRSAYSTIEDYQLEHPAAIIGPGPQSK